MFQVGREKTRMVKQAQKVKQRKIKNKNEETCSSSGLWYNIVSPSTLNLWGWGAFSYALCLNGCCQSLEGK